MTMRTALTLIVLTAARLSAQAADTAHIAPVVVTATRTPLSVEKVPASVTVLSGETLRQQGILSVEDALRTVAGVSVVRTGSFGAQTSVFTRGGQPNYTKVLLDGVPLNDPGGSIDIGTLALEDVERIEVVRGAAGVVWGSDAVSGVVNIVTRRGASAAAPIKVNADARAGTFATRNLGATARGTSSRVAYSVGGRHDASDGIYAFNSKYRNDQGQGSLTAALWNGTTLDLTGRLTNLRANFPTDYTGAPVDSNDYRTERRHVVGAELHHAGPRADVSINATSSLTDGVVDQPANSNDVFNSANRYATRVAREALELRGSHQGSHGVLTLGGALERQVGRSTYDYSSTFGAGTSAAAGDRHNSALFLEAVADRPSVTRTAGVRLDHSSVYGSFVTWRAAVNRRLGLASRLRLNVATGFREPSFIEVLPSDFSTGSPNLKPEQTVSAELGLSHTFARGAELGVTGFVQRFRDMIDFNYNPSTFMGTYENVARARANGAEVELRKPLTPRLTADASYTFLDTKVEKAGFDVSANAVLHEGSPLLRRPKHAGVIGLGFVPYAGAMLDLRANLVGERTDRCPSCGPSSSAAIVTLPGYARLDFSASLPVRRLTPAAALTVRVDNLLDAGYAPVYGYPAAGRAVTAGMRLSM